MLLATQKLTHHQLAKKKPNKNNQPYLQMNQASHANHKDFKETAFGLHLACCFETDWKEVIREAGWLLYEH